MYRGTDLLDTFSVERVGQRLARVLCAAGQGETLGPTAALFAQQQDPVVSNDQGACRISNFGCQFEHVLVLQIYVTGVYSTKS
jgi:hypothetical protein